MTIWHRMKELNLSRYQISKTCSLSWDELSDICYGKRSLSQCDAATVEKLAEALQLSAEALLDLKTGPQEVRCDQVVCASGRLYDPVTGLPGYLQLSIDNLLQGELEQVHYLDCLYDDLYGSINSAQWGGDISMERADYLRKKYLFGENREDEENRSDSAL